jgi:predicted Zn finger-like uncharacterized protein
MAITSWPSHFDLDLFAAPARCFASRSTIFIRIIGLLRDAGNNAIPGFRMRLSCPACQTEYEVPDAALTGRARTLRCGHCDHQWQVAPLAATPAGAELVTGMQLPEAPPPWPPEPPRQEPPRPAMTAERPPTPVSFVPEPPKPAANAAKRKFPIPDAPGTETRDRFDPKSTAKLTYDTASYDYPNDLPVPRTAKKGPSPWLVSILILLIAVVMVWVERVHIMQVWPPSTRLFNAVNGILQQFLPHK